MEPVKLSATLKGYFWPLLASLYPLIFLWSKNYEDVGISEIFLDAAALVLISSAVYFSLLFFLKSNRKASLIASLFLSMFFAFGYIFDHESTFFMWMKETTKIWNFCTIIPLWSALALYCLVIVRRKDEKQLEFWMGLQRSVLATLFLGACCSFFSLYRNKQTIENNDLSTVKTYPSEGIFRPNIYYIILDEYGRADVLKKLYHYDNSSFINFLKERNFFIAEKSCSNYSLTMLSIPSSFFMDYLVIPEEDKDKTFNNCQYSAVEHLNKSDLPHILKQFGYTIINIVNTESFTCNLKEADICYASVLPGVFTSVLFDKTLLGAFMRKFWQLDIRDFNRYYLVKGQFEFLKKIIYDPAPHFVFCHILCPHCPFVFHKNGTRRKTTFSLDKEEQKQFYCDQMSYVNSEMMLILDEIISCDPNAIIIVQGDHGPAYDNWDYYVDGKGIFNHQLLKERMAILNAYYFPKENQPTISPSITPVNSFRIILNHYFKTNLPEVPNKCCWSTGPHYFNITNTYDAEEINSISLHVEVS